MIGSCGSESPARAESRERHNPARPKPGTTSFKTNMAEDAASESPKRKRGRPAKPEGEKAAAKKAKTEDGEKRSRGRPKGSKNKSAKKPKELPGRPLNVLGHGVRHVKACGINWMRPDPPKRSPSPREAEPKTEALSDSDNESEPEAEPQTQSGNKSDEDDS
ncbi:unnamed protein product [Meganyctiphanes norvegica]|uniref:Uncharacterized protein n=1 Tax=Meganyctiphanes norvegica TaxID=48144 RepID=A0AAV2SPT7_MEGNR